MSISRVGPKSAKLVWSTVASWPGAWEAYYGKVYVMPIALARVSSVRGSGFLKTHPLNPSLSPQRASTARAVWRVRVCTNDGGQRVAAAATTTYFQAEHAPQVAPL